MDKLEFVYMIVDKKGRPICWEGGMPMIHKTIDGAKDNTVIRANTLKIRAVVDPVEASSMLRLIVWAQAKSQTKNPAINKVRIKDIFFIIWRNLSLWFGQ